VVEVEFATSDDDYPVVALSAALDCRLELREVSSRESGAADEFYGVERAAPDAVLAAAADVEDVTADLLAGHEDGGLFQFHISVDCPVHELSLLGGVPHDVVVESGHARMTAAVPPANDPAAVVSELLERHPSLELRAKRGGQRPRPLYGESELRVAVERALTERQAEVLRAAHAAGYYERPRRTGSETLADELDINAATFNEHLREAERKLVDAVYGDPDGDAGEAAGAAERRRA